ncbi:hypothetical protein VIBNISFn27_240002 [Vibrio nigripulchritudo SFn27]|nr:hypothetical protein VIBNIMADA3020_520061 [Vibrio nigripulchritudo MADA3020]CCN88106.1 hypothetical protein VIBNISFn27_240002 [Vibrio nigripulchritudo SFn27]
MNDKACHLLLKAKNFVKKISSFSLYALGSNAMECALQQRGCCRLYLRLVTGWFYESKR